MDVTCVKFDKDTDEWAIWYYKHTAEGLEWDTVLSLQSRPKRGSGIGALLRDLVENQVVPGDYIRRDVREA